MKDEIQYRARCPSICILIFRKNDRKAKKREHVGLENLRQHDKLIIVYQPTVRLGHIDSIEREEL